MLKVHCSEINTIRTYAMNLCYLRSKVWQIQLGVQNTRTAPNQTIKPDIADIHLYDRYSEGSFGTYHNILAGCCCIFASELYHISGVRTSVIWPLEKCGQDGGN